MLVGACEGNRSVSVLLLENDCISVRVTGRLRVRLRAKSVVPIGSSVQVFSW